MKKTMKHLCLFLTCMGLTMFTFGQNITVVSALGQNPDTLINQTLAGRGVMLTNGKFNNSADNIAYEQIGTFNRGNSNFPFQSGLIMTTGHISIAPGPNDQNGAHESVDILHPKNFYTDGNATGQLGSLSTGLPLKACAVLDFDFVAYADTFSFDYIFASEEYPEYVGSHYNDMFAFFLTGYDPVTLSQTTRNIAIIPNSITPAHPNGIPVAINSVNNGSAGEEAQWEPAPAGTCHYNYTQYYDPSPSGVQYDGSTVSMTAAAFIVACQTYHMHLAVGNVSDNNYDSGVFLEAGSFYSPSLSIESRYNLPGYDDTLIQNCRETDITFGLARPNATAYTTSFEFGGTAVIDQDYTFIKENGTSLNAENNHFSFQNDTLTMVHLAIKPDAQFNQGECKTVDLYIETVFCDMFDDARCRDTLHFILMPNDSFRLRDTTIVSCRALEHIGGVIENGSDRLNYEWLPAVGINNPHELESDALITQSTTYRIVAADRYGCLRDTAEVKVLIHDFPDIAHTITPQSGCVPLQVDMRVNNPVDGYDYLWVTSHAGTSFVDTGRTAVHHLTLSDAGDYDVFLLGSSAPACTDSVLVLNAVHVADYPHADFTYAPVAPQNGQEVSFFNSSTGDDIVSYHWSFGDGTSSVVENPTHRYHLPNNDNMLVRLTVANADDCVDATAIVIPVVDDFAFWVPNSFTPNSDGYNDVFLPKVRDVASYKLQIFSRTGQLIFVSDDIDTGWDGTFNGKQVPTGVYVWKISYVKYSNENKTIEEFGHVNVIR